MSNATANSLLNQLIEQTTPSKTLQDKALLLKLQDCQLQIFSSSQALLDNLHDYFAELIEFVPASHLDAAALKVFALESNANLNFIEQLEWEDWAREAGKTGRKDAVFDGEFSEQTFRLVYKVKTGMVFFQPSLTDQAQTSPLIAVGPVSQHPNQIINFVLTQYLNQHLRHNWLLGHASGLKVEGKGISIAGLSGGGKSTLMLHLLEVGEHFISNDRLLFNELDGKLIMRGIPKQPRINPGTIVHNPRLHSLMTEQERESFLAMPSEQLRALEHKFDAPVNQLFGENCYQSEAALDALVILNWSVSSPSETAIRVTNFSQSPELIPAILKSPGPFFNEANGAFLANGQTPTLEKIQQRMGRVPVLELNGKVDFGKAKQLVLGALQAV